MDNFYNQSFLENSIIQLEDVIADLSKWDAYNDDYYNEEIGILQKILDLIKQKEEREENSVVGRAGQDENYG